MDNAISRVAFATENYTATFEPDNMITILSCPLLFSPPVFVSFLPCSVCDVLSFHSSFSLILLFSPPDVYLTVVHWDVSCVLLILYDTDSNCTSTSVPCIVSNTLCRLHPFSFHISSGVFIDLKCFLKVLLPFFLCQPQVSVITVLSEIFVPSLCGQRFHFFCRYEDGVAYLPFFSCLFLSISVFLEIHFLYPCHGPVVS